MKLTNAQTQLLEQLKVNPDVGLSTDEATKRREEDNCFNVVHPPVKCPAWICCLLPCIKNIPSMKAYQRIKPEDAEVLRDGKWVRYDAASLVRGDIIQLEEGDIVPADCVVLSVDNDDDSDDDDDEENNDNGAAVGRILVDTRYVTGEDKPRSASPIHANGGEEKVGIKPIQLFFGSQVVQGSGKAAVTAIGPNTLLASLIREKKFPVEIGRGGLSSETENQYSDEEVGISLVTRDTL